jgi:RNA polymerase subunit RPABC4/transcription elongation factor Spt4
MCTAASNRGAYACGSDKICRVCGGEFVTAQWKGVIGVE